MGNWFELGPNATDINPFDESIVGEVFGGTTPQERAGNPSDSQNLVFENMLDSIPRQFDGRPGGGFADEMGNQADQQAQKVLPKWLRKFLSDPKKVTNVLVIVAALYLLGPVIELAAAILGN